MSGAVEAGIESAAEVLRAGGVICHATEGVWGFACDPFNEAAVLRLLQIKQRSPDKGLLVIGASAAQFAPELDLCAPGDADQVVATWPGPNSWILPNHRFPPWVTGAHIGVGCRVPGHAQARALCEQAGVLVSTSANPSGGASLLTQQAVESHFATEVDLVLPGEVCDPGRASTIRNLGGQVLRA